VPVLGMAIVAGAIAYLTGIAAARRLGAKLASFVGLIEVVFAVMFAWLLLGQRLDAMQLAGGVLVVLGIALVRLDEMRIKVGPCPGSLTPAMVTTPSAPPLPAASATHV
jgi:drug/metabolite transporter (DMT)-like permease